MEGPNFCFTVPRVVLNEIEQEPLVYMARKISDFSCRILVIMNKSNLIDMLENISRE